MNILLSRILWDRRSVQKYAEFVGDGNSLPNAILFKNAQSVKEAYNATILTHSAEVFKADREVIPENEVRAVEANGVWSFDLKSV